MFPKQIWTALLNGVAKYGTGRYDAMIFEALSTIKDKNGCDFNAIVHFIEQMHKAPQKFRRLLSSRLGRLVSQGKLEKEQNKYRISKDVLGPRASHRKLKGSRKKLEEAAISVAYKVTEAENKSYLADEAVKEAERVSEIAENTYAMLQLVREVKSFSWLESSDVNLETYPCKSPGLSCFECN